MRYRLRLFGTFETTFEGTPVKGFPTAKTRALLTYLALETAANDVREFSRRELASFFWPEIGDKYALQNLRATLYRLHQTFAAVDEQGQIVSATREAVSFDVSRVDVDVAQFQALLTASSKHKHNALETCDLCMDRLNQAQALYRGELMAGFSLSDAPPFEEWLFLQRERQHQQAIIVAGKLLRAYEVLGAFDQAIAVARRLLELDPYREDAHRTLMRVAAMRGLSTQALAQFQKLHQLIGQELGLEPSQETIALAEQIRHGRLDEQRKDKERDRQQSTAIQQSPAAVPPQPQGAKSNFGVSSTLDVSEVPIVGFFFGRHAECTQLTQWICRERAQVVAILGLGGMGKTTLAAQFVRALAESTDVADIDTVLWRSLLNAPTLEEILPPILQQLSDQQLTVVPESIDEQLRLLCGYLREQRVLLVLDNMESILEPGKAGDYRPGYQLFAQLIQQMATREHQSHLLLTSRERPRGYQRLERDSDLVQSLQLNGLDEDAGHKLLMQSGLQGVAGEEAVLIARYSGNPLALKLVADTVEELFDGNLKAFLQHDSFIFDDIRTVLDQHFARLSELEQQILFWLAVTREPMSMQEMRTVLLRAPRQQQFVEALRNLQRCSLIEHSENDFGLQNVITEYLTDRLVESAIHELTHRELNLLHRHPLMIAQAKEYVRQSQARLLLAPLGEQLLVRFGQPGLADRLQRILDTLRRDSPRAPGYVGGNILNLLLYLGIDVTGYDFSQLSVWQAFLQGMTLPNVNFTQADLTQSVFTNTFSVVYAVALSPKGDLLAVGSADGVIRLWQTPFGQPAITIKGHDASIFSIAFNPDGDILASGSVDRTVRLWDVTSGSVRSTLRGHTEPVRSVMFSPDGETLASGGDYTVRLWDVASGSVRRILDGHTDSVYSVAFSPDGQTLASGSSDQTVRLWDVSTPGVEQTRHILQGAMSRILAVAYSCDGQILAGGCADGTVYLWDAHTEKPRHTLRGHTKVVNCLAFSPNGQTLASGSEDLTVRLWDVGALGTWQTRRILQGHSNWIYDIAFSSDGETLASGSEDHTVRLWDANTGEARRTLQGYANWIIAIAFSPDGEILVSGSRDGILRLWDAAAKVATTLDAEQARGTLLGHKHIIWSVAFSPNGETLASGSEDHTVRLWDMATGSVRSVLDGHTDSVWEVTFSADGETLVSCSSDCTVRLWDVGSGTARAILDGHTDAVYSVALSPDGETLASGSADGTVYLWDVPTGQIRHILRGHTSSVWSIAFCPDGEILASSGSDRTVRLWNVHTGQAIHTLEEYIYRVNNVIFSPDGQFLVSSSANGTIHVWDVSTWQPRHILEGHAKEVSCLAFSPDGETLASSSHDETIKLWDLLTGKYLHTLRQPGPYEGMNITGVTGISEAQRAALKALGAVEFG